MRESSNQIQAGVIRNGYSYTHQCWIKDFIIQDCGHPQDMPCACFGRQHAGEQARFAH
jgi:hypothetical protein